MPVCGVMGSCLANLTSVFLTHDYRWERLNNANGVRSDHYLEYLIGRRAMMPQEKLLSMLEFEPKSEADLKARIRENYVETCGTYQMQGNPAGLFQNLETKKFDLFVMDNLYDIAVRSAHYKAPQQEEAFSLNLPFNALRNAAQLREYFYFGPYLDGAEAANNWLKIIEYVQQRQPAAAIFFLCGHYCTSAQDPSRYGRAVHFYTELSRLVGGRKINVVPPLDLDPSLMKDFYHYDMSVYKALAGYIHLNIAAKWESLSEGYRLPPHVLTLAESKRGDP